MNRRRAIGCVGLGAVCLVSGACRRAAEPEPAVPADVPGAVRIVSNDGTYVVTYVPHPAVIPTNEWFTLAVEIRKTADPKQVPSDVTLAVDASMPAHGHGMNTAAQVQPTREGRFEVQGMLFHMTGHWELYFDITDGPLTERAQCDVNLE